MTIGFFGGVISSLLGVGGGIVNVPVLNLLMKVPIKAAIATSSLLLCFTTMTGSIIYAYNGYVMPYIIAPLIPGIFLGAQLGARIARHVEGHCTDGHIHCFPSRDLGLNDSAGPEYIVR